MLQREVSDDLTGIGSAGPSRTWQKRVVLEGIGGYPGHRLFEAKARKELALTGNIKAMIEYVGKYGGHLELWIRSDKHPEGATHLTGPLRDELRKLEQRGRAALRAYP